jgi:hypothetical protein
MNRYVNIGFSCAVAALIGLWAASLGAQQPTPAGRGRAANPPPTQPAQPAQPTGRGGRGGRAAEGTQQEAGRGTNIGSDIQGNPSAVPTTTTVLGAVHIAKAVKADGQPLAPGTYQMRVTEREATPAAAGQTPQFERWAEFLQGGQVKGREVVTIVTSDAARQVMKEKFPPSGGYRAEVLKGGDYYRVWFNKGGTHYLVHFNI